MRLKRYLSYLCATLCSCFSAANADQRPAAPPFETFPALDIWTGANATPKLTAPSAYAYITRIRRAAQLPANFAGHFRLETWGSREGCITGIAVNLKTGDIVFLPETICAETHVTDPTSRHIEFRPDSSLIALRSSIQGKEGQKLFSFDGTRFIPVVSLAKNVPTKSPGEPAASVDKDKSGGKSAPPVANTPVAPPPAEATGVKQSLNFNACGSTWGYYIDQSDRPDLSLLFQGIDQGPALVLHLKEGAKSNDLSGTHDRDRWNLDLTVRPSGQEALSRIVYSGRLLNLSISFVQAADNKLVLVSFGVEDTGKPCPAH